MFKRWLASSIILIVSLSALAESGYAYEQQVVSLQPKLENVSKSGLKQQLPKRLLRKVGEQILRLRIRRRPDLKTISDPRLVNVIENLYRSEDRVVPGGTAGAIIYERMTGRLINGKSHIEKGENTMRQLENIFNEDLKRPPEKRLSPQQRKIADDIYNDLKNALFPGFTP